VFRRLAFLALAALAMLSACCPSVLADGLKLKADRLDSFTIFKQQKTFGPLEWRGGLYLTSEDVRFGGLSSLEMSNDGAKLLAISDAGFWIRADVSYENGELAGLASPEIASIIGSDGKPLIGKFVSDAEALAGWTPGNLEQVLVAFESKVRAGTFDLASQGLAARMKPLKLPDAIGDGPYNSEIESIGRFSSGPLKGSIVAVSELNLDEAGDIRAWIFGGKRKFDFTIKRYGDYAVTDLAILPDGNVIILERSFEGLLPGMALRLIRTADIAPDGVVAPEFLFEARAPIHAIDNMEGIAVSQSPEGETRLTLVSDDNFNHHLQRTLVLQFALKSQKLTK
jgi:hypothetical protein